MTIPIAVPTSTPIDKILQSAKAIAGLVSTVCVALVASGLDDPAARIVAIIGAVAGAILVYNVPNAKTPEQKIIEAAGVDALLPADEYPDGYENAVAQDQAE